ncbi:MAG: ribonuclease P protein component [Rhodobacterales bacterium]|nr:MAG: ribonuclease P protein component [Rhodobacterales bacterium]
MTPPSAPAAGNTPRAASVPEAVSSCLPPALITLRKRSDFLQAARARRRACAGLILQARRRRSGEADTDGIRVGFTCSKKVGNAVARNRAKRRLRAIARTVLPELGQPGWDYVLIGRKQITAERPYPDMLADLRHALTIIHGPRK